MSHQVARLLGISPEKIVLLDSKTRLLLQSLPSSDLQEWSCGTGKGHDGIRLQFHGTKPWMLTAPSVTNLKSVTAALWDVMGIENRALDTLPFYTDIDFGKALGLCITQIKFFFNKIKLGLL